MFWRSLIICKRHTCRFKKWISHFVIENRKSVRLKVFPSRYDHAISLFIVWWRFYLGFIINGYSLLVQVGFKIQTTLTIFIFSIEFNFEKRLSSFYFYTLGICWENSNQRTSFWFFFISSFHSNHGKMYYNGGSKSLHHWSVRTTAPKRESPNDSAWMLPIVSLIKIL